MMLILTGAGLAWLGLKNYRLSLALSFGIPSLISSFIVMSSFPSLEQSKTAIMVTILVITLLIYFLATIVTYFNAFCYIAGFLSFVLLTVNVEPIVPLTLILFLFSAVVVFVIRKHLKPILIGLSSGFSIGFGAAAIILPGVFKSGNFMDASTFPAILTLIGMVGGVVFQYQYIIKKDPGLLLP